VASEPERLIGDKAYDSDELDATLAQRGIQMIAPHRSNRVRAKTQDGRPLRRYKRRWKVERLNSWLLSHRRIVVRLSTRWRTSLALFNWRVSVSCFVVVFEMSSSEIT